MRKTDRASSSTRTNSGRLLDAIQPGIESNGLTPQRSTSPQRKTSVKFRSLPESLPFRTDAECESDYRRFERSEKARERLVLDLAEANSRRQLAIGLSILVILISLVIFYGAYREKREALALRKTYMERCGL